jgi:hypothetical protein
MKDLLSSLQTHQVTCAHQVQLPYWVWPPPQPRIVSSSVAVIAAINGKQAQFPSLEHDLQITTTESVKAYEQEQE